MRYCRELAWIGGCMSALPFVIDLDRPICMCGQRMRFASTIAAANDLLAEVRIFDCKHCPHEMRIMHSLNDEAALARHHAD